MGHDSKEVFHLVSSVGTRANLKNRLFSEEPNTSQEERLLKKSGGIAGQHGEEEWEVNNTSVACELVVGKSRTRPDQK